VEVTEAGVFVRGARLAEIGQAVAVVVRLVVDDPALVEALVVGRDLGRLPRAHVASSLSSTFIHFHPLSSTLE
jgi:hypothetical protein